MPRALYFQCRRSDRQRYLADRLGGEKGVGGSRLAERKSPGHVDRKLLRVDQPGELKQALAVGHDRHALDPDIARTGVGALRKGWLRNGALATRRT